MSCIREMALKEPLVDVVDSKQVVTSHFMMREIDLYTIKEDEIAFDVPFALRVHKDDYVQAFVAYFTIEFSKCHTKIAFSTGNSYDFHTLFQMNFQLMALFLFWHFTFCVFDYV